METSQALTRHSSGAIAARVVMAGWGTSLNPVAVLSAIRTKFLADDALQFPLTGNSITIGRYPQPLATCYFRSFGATVAALGGPLLSTSDIDVTPPGNGQQEIPECSHPVSKKRI
jgi:hypothetical protein